MKVKQAKLETKFNLQEKILKDRDVEIKFLKQNFAQDKLHQQNLEKMKVQAVEKRNLEDLKNSHKIGLQDKAIRQKNSKRQADKDKLENVRQNKKGKTKNKNIYHDSIKEHR